MKVLFIGGTGIISTAVCKVAVDKGIDLYVLNRGKQNDKLPKGVTILQGDIYNEAQIASLLDGHYFDSIVQWISFTVEHVTRDVRLFKGHTAQYIFISSASAYFKPIPYLPVTEALPLDNKYWEYSDNKKKCEEYLLSKHSNDFNVTIIRPSHTYNDEMLISQLNSHSHPFTLLNRILEGKQVILPDGGTNLWTITYNMDFAHAFVDVIGNPKTYGEYYHLTGEKVYTWERLYESICIAAGVSQNAIFIDTDEILETFPEFKGELYGDKMKSLTFDNSKIKKVAPNYKSETEYPDIAKHAVKRFLENEELQTIDLEFDKRYDECINKHLEKRK